MNFKKINTREEVQKLKRLQRRVGKHYMKMNNEKISSFEIKI